MLGMRQAGRVHKTGVLHAEPLRLFHHQLRKQVFRTRNRLGQCNRGVVTALDNHAANQRLDHRCLLRIDKHARTFGAPGSFGYGHRLREREFFFFQRLKHQICCHQLGERCGFKAIGGGLLRERLSAGGVEQHVGARGDWRCGNVGDRDDGLCGCGLK